jgi:hypothetical protein
MKREDELMNAKKIATYALLAFVIVSIAYFASAEMGKKRPVDEAVSIKTENTSAENAPTAALEVQEPNIAATEEESATAVDSAVEKPENKNVAPNAKEKKVSEANKNAQTPAAASQTPVPTQASQAQQAAEPEKKVPQKEIIVYYFKTTNGCASCTYVENYTGEALKTGFKKQMDDGTIEWKVVNLDNPGDRHFIQDYQLSFKSVIVAEFEDGKQKRWKNLEMVWRLYRNKPEFLTFVQDEVKAYLEGK